MQAGWVTACLRLFLLTNITIERMGTGLCEHISVSKCSEQTHEHQCIPVQVF